MSFDKKFLDETGSENSFGRTIWAIGHLVRMAPNDSHFQFAKDLFFRSMPHFENVQSIRAIASIIIGLCNFLKRYPDNETIMHLLNDLTWKLTRQYQDEAEGDWRWFEPVLCYDSAMLPLALWHAYSATRNKEIYAVAAESTAFIDRATSKNGHMSLVGNAWYYKGHSMPSQGQQPIDAMAMVMMYQKALIVTKDETYHQKMRTAFSWITGNNDLHIPLYDEYRESSRCCRSNCQVL